MFLLLRLSIKCLVTHFTHISPKCNLTARLLVFLCDRCPAFYYIKPEDSGGAETGRLRTKSRQHPGVTLSWYSLITVAIMYHCVMCSTNLNNWIISTILLCDATRRQNYIRETDQGFSLLSSSWHNMLLISLHCHEVSAMWFNQLSVSFRVPQNSSRAGHTEMWKSQFVSSPRAYWCFLLEMPGYSFRSI